MTYDDVGALGGLFAPAYISGDQQSMDAVARWNAAHLKTPPAAADPPPTTSGSFGGAGDNGSKAQYPNYRPGTDLRGNPLPPGTMLAPSLYTPGSTAITNGPTGFGGTQVNGGPDLGGSGTQVNGGPDLGSRDAIASLLMGGNKSGLR